MAKCGSMWRQHDFVPCGKEEITEPKRGPFDPRTDKQRTVTHDMMICAQCGYKTKAYIGVDEWPY